jgi:hypothetical protein
MGGDFLSHPDSTIAAEALRTGEWPIVAESPR